MRRLLIGISALVVALMLMVGGTDHARADGTGAVINVPASHVEGGMISMVAYCMTVPFVDLLMEQAIIPGNAERYREIMIDETHISCVEHRFFNVPPLFVTLVNPIKTIKTDAGLLLEIWEVVDHLGETAYTWVSHSGEDT